MDLTTALLLAATALPAPYAPPARAEVVAEERAAFLPVLAEELASAAEEATCTGEWATVDFCQRIWPGSAREIAALTLAIGWHESRLDPRIQRGDCRAWSSRHIECDGVRLPDGTIYFRAQSLWQLHGRFAEPVIGLDHWEIRNAAKRAITVLALSRGRCGRGPHWAEGTVSAYAGTLSCSWRGARARVRTFGAILRTLEG